MLESFLLFKDLEVDIDQNHLIRHPPKFPFKALFKNHFFGRRYPYPRNGSRTIMIVCTPLRGEGILFRRSGALKGVLLNDSGPMPHFSRSGLL